MKYTIKHHDYNTDFTVDKNMEDVLQDKQNKLFTREYFIEQFKQWIKTPTLKETKW